jgi:hypothetical protein
MKILEKFRNKKEIWKDMLMLAILLTAVMLLAIVI